MADENAPGQMSPNDTSSRFNAIAFQIKQHIAQNVTTMKPVRVVAVYGPDGEAIDENSLNPAAIGYVDVQPVVKQMNAAGETMDHGIISRIPYVRAQGGKVAFVTDPQVGDVGSMVCSDRDMSALKANRGEDSTPGSHRTFDPADGVYVGAFTGKDAPEAFIYWRKDHWLISPDKGVTYLAIRPGEIVLWSKKLVLHGEELATLDAGGTGYEYMPSAIDDYTQGVTPTPHPPNPPAVPKAEAAKEK